MSLPNGCPRCCGRITFEGGIAKCIQCGWELLADGIHPLDAAVA